MSMFLPVSLHASAVPQVDATDPVDTNVWTHYLVSHLGNYDSLYVYLPNDILVFFVGLEAICKTNSTQKGFTLEMQTVHLVLSCNQITVVDAV